MAATDRRESPLGLQVMTSPELELDGLRRRYGTVTALDGLTFGVPAGQVFGFLGPNGAGKTTAMRAIFGVAALDAGEIRWRGRPVDAGRAPHLRLHARGARPLPGHGAVRPG